jgi:hypothetical protein
LALCKVLETMCTHQRTLLANPAVESCAMMMFQRMNSLPLVCDTRIVRLSHTVWTQLANNSWIHFAPFPDTMTILCHGKSPTAVAIKGVGKLQVSLSCRGMALQWYSIVIPLLITAAHR